MIQILHFIWDETNITHIARHHVKPDEAEEVFESKYYLRRMWGERYIALGKSYAGRYIFVAFDYFHKEKVVYIATARDQDQKERRLYKKR